MCSLIVNYNIIHCCVVTILKIIRYDRESVALIIKYFISGVFFVYAFYGFQEKRFLRSCGAVLVIIHYEPDTIFQEQARNE